MTAALSMSNPVLGSTLGAFDAKTHFSKILEWVAKGKEFVVTKHGKPVARISPMQDAVADTQEALMAKRRAAMDWIRANPIKSVKGQAAKDLIAEGRKW